MMDSDSFLNHLEVLLLLMMMLLLMLRWWWWWWWWWWWFPFVVTDVAISAALHNVVASSPRKSLKSRKEVGGLIYRIIVALDFFYLETK